MGSKTIGHLKVGGCVKVGGVRSQATVLCTFRIWAWGTSPTGPVCRSILLAYRVERTTGKGWSKNNRPIGGDSLGYSDRGQHAH